MNKRNKLDLTLQELTEGRKPLPPGTERIRGGKKYVKNNQGGWDYVGNNKVLSVKAETDDRRPAFSDKQINKWKSMDRNDMNATPEISYHRGRPEVSPDSVKHKIRKLEATLASIKAKHAK